MLAPYLDPIATLAATATSPTPLFATAASLFQRALAEGRAQQDIGCVIELYEDLQPKKGRSP
jgi:hypothetical protein